MIVPSVAKRLAIVQERIGDAPPDGGRSPADITLVGVAKGASRAAIDDAYAGGLRDVGENRVQEAHAKFAVGLPSGVTLAPDRPLADEQGP